MNTQQKEGLFAVAFMGFALVEGVLIVGIVFGSPDDKVLFIVASVVNIVVICGLAALKGAIE